jgi:hypothetical protein
MLGRSGGRECWVGFNAGARRGATMPKADDADRDERLKKIDHENAVNLKRLEFDYALRRDALAYTKEYGLFTLKSCLILNGGAILAMLTFIGNLYGRGISTHTLKIHDFNCALMIYIRTWAYDYCINLWLFKFLCIAKTPKAIYFAVPWLPRNRYKNDSPIRCYRLSDLLCVRRG